MRSLRASSLAFVLLAAGGVASLAGGPATTAASAQATTPAAQVNPAPPKVATAGVESVSRTGATLTGSVTSGLAETSYRFQYGTTSSYGLTTAAATLPPSASAAPVKVAIAGLTPSTTYHYRVVATNAAGTTNGSDKSFKTVSNPKAPSVSSQAATGIDAQVAIANARINPQGQATNYYFQYGTSTRYSSKSVVQSAGAGTATVAVGAAISGLKPYTKYYFRVVAVNATGTVRGSSRSFRTTRGIRGVGIGARRTVTWNQPAVIQGTVGALDARSVKVGLLRQDFPFIAPFVQVATQTTSSAGAYSFTVGPLYTAARFQVATATTPPAASRVIDVRNRLLTKLRISTKRSKTMTLAGRVYPAVPNGRTSVQRRTSKGRWIRVKRAKLRSDTVANRSTYRVSVPRLSRTTRYRVLIQARDNGAHLTGTTKSVSVSRRR